MNSVEIAANFFNLVSVHLARKNSIHTWSTGIVACVLFAFLFFGVKLYADLTLQIFFILTSFYGLWNWRFGNKNKTELPVTPIQLMPFLGLIVLAIICTAGYGAILHYFTDASYPFVDSTVLMFSILAQFLLTGRKIENWPIWILVNLVSIPLFVTKELYLTAAIYFIFLINALVAWKQWHKLLQRT